MAGSGSAAAQDQMKRRIAELEHNLQRATAAKQQLEVRAAANISAVRQSDMHRTRCHECCLNAAPQQHSADVAKLPNLLCC